MDVAIVVIRLGLAVVFGVAGLAKLTDRAGFTRALREFAVPAALVGTLAVAVPVVELGIAVALVLPGVAWWAAMAAAALLIAFMILIGVSLSRGRTPDCNCFGRLSAGPVGRKTLVRNGVFVLAAAAVVAAGPARSAPSALGWFGTLDPVQQVGLGAAVVIGILLTTQGWLLVHLMRQNGRLLDRVTALEHHLHQSHRTELPLLPASNGGNGHQHGPRVGDSAPAVSLPDLDGNPVDLTEFRGTPVALLFWSPSCGFCQKMLPDLLTWERERPADAPKLLVVATGSAEENRAMGLAAPVLLDSDYSTGRAYGSNGTPQAVLVDAEGAIASPLAAGGPAVLNLLKTELSKV